MIIREFYIMRDDGINLYHTYSDQGYKIRQIETDILYDAAIDVENARYTYEESDILIVEPESSPTEPEDDLEEIPESDNSEEEISAEEFMALIEEIL